MLTHPREEAGCEVAAYHMTCIDRQWDWVKSEVLPVIPFTWHVVLNCTKEIHLLIFANI